MRTLGPKYTGNQSQDVKTNLNRIGPQSNVIKVHEAFTLDYKVKWPLTLIISKKSINKYQLIFRHLLQCKYTERYLEQVWLHHQSIKEYNVQGMLM